MSAIALGVGIAGASVLGSGIEGLLQKHKANQIQKSLKDPVYQIPAEFQQNKNIAQQMAQVGLPGQVYNNNYNQIRLNQAAGIAAANNSANPGAAIAGITGNTNAAIGNLNAEDAQARQNNQRFSIDQNTAYANQELAKQQSDVFDKYTRNYNEMQAYRGAGNQNLNNAFNGLSSIGGGLLGNFMGAGSQSQQTMGQAYGLPTLSASNPNQPYVQQQAGIPYYQIAQ